MQCLLVKVVGVCLKRSLLCLRRVTPGLCAVMVDGGTDFAFSVGKPTLRQHLALVSGLNTHIFLFHLMYLRMGGVDDGSAGKADCAAGVRWGVSPLLQSEAAFCLFRLSRQKHARYGELSLWG